MQLQLDPLQVLALLAPKKSVDEAAASLPALRAAVKTDVTDLYEQAIRRLFKVSGKK